MDLDQLLLDTAGVVEQTGNFIQAEAGNFDNEKVEMKGFNDLVSYVDQTAEKMLVEGLKPLLPEAGFILEEESSQKSSFKEEFRWIIDPLDGTTNFVHGVPCYAISVALARKDEVVLGIILELNTGDLFSARKEGGAFLNNKSIRVSGTRSASESLVATGFPYTDFTHMHEYMKVFDHCMKHTRGIRRLGSASVDLAYTACGRFDVFYEYGLNPWDVAAGIILVREAGGVVTDFNGGEDYLFGREILAGATSVHAEFLNVTRSAFGYS